MSQKYLFFICILFFNTISNSIFCQDTLEKIKLNFILEDYTLDSNTKETINRGINFIAVQYSNLFHINLGDNNKIIIHIFDNQAAYLNYSKKIVSSAVSQNGFYSYKLNKIIIWKNKNNTVMLKTIFHETSHFLLRSQIKVCPKWLNEGLAEYFEELELSNNQIKINPQKNKEKRCKNLLDQNKLPILVNYFEINNRAWINDNAKNAKISSTIAWSLVYYMMSSQKGQILIEQILHYIKNNPSKKNASLDAFEKYIPEGLAQFEMQWRNWLSKTHAVHYYSF